MSVEEEICTVQVSSAGTEEPSSVTITVNPASGDDEGAVIQTDQEDAIATSALQMVEDVNIMDGKDLFFLHIWTLNLF